MASAKKMASVQKSQSGSASKKPEKKPRLLSGYTVFRKSYQHKVKNLPFGDAAKAASAKWKSLSDEKKAKYNAKALKFGPRMKGSKIAIANYVDSDSDSDSSSSSSSDSDSSSSSDSDSDSSSSSSSSSDSSSTSDSD